MMKTALITGATSGIGLELAKLFAADNYRLVIVARHEDQLYKTADTLKRMGAKDVICVPCDLSFPGSAQELFDDVRRRDVLVNVLVNDAGAGEYGPFSETPLEEELAIIQLNVASVVHLTKLFLREMLERDEGRILQVASIASYQPTPYLAVYAATKAFVLSFTDAVINEISHTNVKMTALIPGATDTQFFERAHAAHTRAAQHREDPAVVAKTGYDALERGQPHAVAPGVTRQIVMSSVMPNKAVAAMARRQMEEE